MKYIAVIALVAVAASVLVSFSSTSASDYDLFLAKYRKNYTSLNEYEFRKAIFEQTQKLIEEENSKNNSYKLAMNHFGDWTEEEYRSILGYKRTRPHVKPSNWGMQVPKSDVTIDWVAEGAVSPVKNQGSCGSCWTFSAVGALEGAHAIANNGKVQEFAEQQLVDCSKNGNYGCNGGEMYNAFAWYKSHGACFEENYKYVAKNQVCADSKCTSDSKPISSYNLFEKDDPSILHAELAHAPHSLGVEAGNSIFRYYSSGEIDSDKCGHRLDHGVLLVGYDAKRDAWKIKNSWGTGYGENGYVYVKDNHEVSYGYCGVNMEISRPIL